MITLRSPWMRKGQNGSMTLKAPALGDYKILALLSSQPALRHRLLSLIDCHRGMTPLHGPCYLHPPPSVMRSESGWRLSECVYRRRRRKNPDTPARPIPSGP